MNSSLRRLLLLVLLGGTAAAQMPPGVVEAERAKLLEGVQTLPKAGAPGPIAVWGRLAFPLLAAADRNGTEAAIAAVAGQGRGRILLFGHNAYLDGSAGGDHAKLLANAVRWVSKKDRPRVGLYGVNAEAFYSPLAARLEKLQGPLAAGKLSALDVLVLNAQGVTSAEEAAAILRWIENGGGLIAGMTGWAFAQTSRGGDLAADHGLNQALASAGLAFTDQGGFNTVNTFQARRQLPELMHAGKAVAALEGKTMALPAGAASQAAAAIQLALAAQPPGNDAFQAVVLKALGGSGGKSASPTLQRPLTEAGESAERIRLGVEMRVLRLSAPETTAAHPAHEAFPGKVPAAAPRVERSVTVDATVPGWTSTGLYAAAGEVIRVTLPAELAGRGFAVRIGCHSDTLYHLDLWQRAPEICKSAPVRGAETRLASAFGGLIYVEVPSGEKSQGTFNAMIRGGLEAPRFVLGEHSDAQWRDTLRKLPAPWAEFECDKIILTCPTEAARAVNNPTELMEFWRKVVEAQDEITNQATERRRPERIVADVQISAGYMHSGYPIMIPVSAAAEMVTLNRLKFPGWGFYHEIGHNHQRPHFTFEGTGEVTNNVIGMWCYEAVLGKDWLIGHPNIAPEARRAHVEKIRAASDKWMVWKSDPFLALTTYIQLVQEFGWESWRRYLHSFADPAFGPAPADDAQRRDQFLVRYSKIVGRNLGPFFEFWGIPVGATAKQAVAGLESWMPAD
jgi:hypothetical protein